MSDDGYAYEEIERLLGLREGHKEEASKHITIVDIVSWARDPGGDFTWCHLALEMEPGVDWTARRGPLTPHGGLACVLYDFLRAMKRLPLRDQAVVVLTAFGFKPSEIASIVGIDRGSVRRILYGRDERFEKGALRRITDSMNGK